MASEHLVQFFDDQRSLTRGVARFLAEGAANGESLLVVARSAKWLRIAERLQASGVDLDAFQRSGRLVVLDAVRTLDAITHLGEPQAESFERVIGTLVHTLAARPLRVYGEMVDILAEEANFDAVQRLEDLWNGLARKDPFVLLCGYCSVHFGSEAAGGSLRRICSAHSRTLSNAGDELASWLLASNGIRSGVSAA